jgi:uncharacterized protein (DUF433 family)
MRNFRSKGRPPFVPWGPDLGKNQNPFASFVYPVGPEDRTGAVQFLNWRKNMEYLLLLKRITFNKDVLCGKPLIRGLRISVEMILELLAKGATEQEIMEDYPELEPDDLRAALLYAHHMVAREDVFDRIEA